MCAATFVYGDGRRERWCYRLTRGNGRVWIDARPHPRAAFGTT